jgi:EAL domain-containing protein (putative c-di-GMP-specific phosphodiesterase class I)
MRVCAEGVETQAQLEQLAAFDVDSVQGFLFTRALPPAEFESYVRAWYAPEAADPTNQTFQPSNDAT